AARLRHALRESDVVARLGGDEFAALLPGADQSGAVQAAEKLRAALDAPFELERRAFHVDASIGIALYSEHGTDAQALLREADVAMYQAKHARTGYAVYSGAHDEHRRHRWVLASALPDAIASGQLVLHYQPQVALAPGRADGLEALVRWSYP